MAGSTRSGSYGSSCSSAKRLTPTTIRSPASTAPATSYAARSISSFWKPCSIAATVPPRSATGRSSAGVASMSGSATPPRTNRRTGRPSATPVSWAITCWVRRASLAALAVGRATPRRPSWCAATGCRRARPRALAGSPGRGYLGLLRVQLDAGGLGGERSISERGSRAPNRSRITDAHIRRAARNLATSSRSVVRGRRRTTAGARTRRPRCRRRSQSRRR